MVQHGFPEAFADGFLTLQNEDVGQPAFISSEVEEILGRPAHTFAERAAEHAADFRN
jgi:hypothetical protein